MNKKIKFCLAIISLAVVILFFENISATPIGGNCPCDSYYYTDHGVFEGYCVSGKCQVKDGLDGRQKTVDSIQGYVSGDSKTNYFTSQYDVAGNQIKSWDDQNNLLREGYYDFLGTGLPYYSWSKESGAVYSKFDSTGKVLEVKDSKESKAVFTYDSLDRNTLVNYYKKGETNPSFFVKRCFDSYCGGGLCSNDGTTSSFGLLCEIQDSTGSTKWAYDQRNRIVKENKTVTSGNAGTQQFITTYGYSVGDLLDNQTMPDGKIVKYVYDDIGRLKTVSYDNAKVGEISYNEFSAIKNKKLGSTNVITEDFYYDTKQQLTSFNYVIPNNDPIARSMKYDRVGNIREISYSINPTNPTSYSGVGKEFYKYDNLYRIRNATYPGASFSYTYLNRLGDRGTKIRDSLTSTYQYSGSYLQNIVTPGLTTKYSYDPTGNVVNISKQTSTGTNNTFIEYDALGRVSSVTTPQGKSEFWYDYTNQRILKKTSDGVNTFYVYNGGKVVFEKKTASGGSNAAANIVGGSATTTTAQAPAPITTPSAPSTDATPPSTTTPPATTPTAPTTTTTPSTATPPSTTTPPATTPTAPTTTTTPSTATPPSTTTPQPSAIIKFVNTAASTLKRLIQKILS
jgi:YD repeat-containing protein